MEALDPTHRHMYFQKGKRRGTFLPYALQIVTLNIVLAVVVLCHLILAGCQKANPSQSIAYRLEFEDAPAFNNSDMCPNLPIRSIFRSPIFLKTFPPHSTLSLYMLLDPLPNLRIVLLLLAVLFTLSERIFFLFLSCWFVWRCIIRRLLKPTIWALVSLAVAKLFLLGYRITTDSDKESYLLRWEVWLDYFIQQVATAAKDVAHLSVWSLG